MSQRLRNDASSSLSFPRLCRKSSMLRRDGAELPQLIPRSELKGSHSVARLHRVEPPEQANLGSPSQTNLDCLLDVDRVGVDPHFGERPHEPGLSLGTEAEQVFEFVGQPRDCFVELDEPELKVERLLPQLIEWHRNRHPLCEQSIAIFKCASDCGETILEHFSLGVGQLQPIKEFQAPGRGTVAGFKSRHAEDLRSQIRGRGRVPTMGAARGDPLTALLLTALLLAALLLTALLHLRVQESS